MPPKKVTEFDLDKEVEAASKLKAEQQELNTSRASFYFIAAFFTTLLPSYLFQGVRNLDFSGFTIALYLVVCGAAAKMLSDAYSATYARMYPKLRERYTAIIDAKKGQFSQEDAKDANEKKTQFIDYGALGYSIGIANLIYLFLVLFFSFYALRKTDVRVSFTVSLLLSAYLVNLLSTSSKKQ